MVTSYLLVPRKNNVLEYVLPLAEGRSPAPRRSIELHMGLVVAVPHVRVRAGRETRTLTRLGGGRRTKPPRGTRRPPPCPPGLRVLSCCGAEASRQGCPQSTSEKRRLKYHLGDTGRLAHRANLTGSKPRLRVSGRSAWSDDSTNGAESERQYCQLASERVPNAKPFVLGLFASLVVAALIPVVVALAPFVCALALAQIVLAFALALVIRTVPTHVTVSFAFPALL